MRIKGFGVELLVSTKGCQINRTAESGLLLEIAGYSLECEKFIDGFYIRFNSHEWSIWT